MKQKPTKITIIADKLDIIYQTLWHFVVFEKIPTIQRKPKMLIDLNGDHPFLKSTKLAMKYNLKIFYTLSDMSALMNLDPKTILKQLNEFDINIQNAGRRGSRAYIYLIDLITFFNKQEALSDSFIRHMRKYQELNNKKPRITGE